MLKRDIVQGESAEEAIKTVKKSQKQLARKKAVNKEKEVIENVEIEESVV